MRGHREKSSSRGTDITRLFETRVPSYRTCCNSTMVPVHPYHPLSDAHACDKYASNDTQRALLRSEIHTMLCYCNKLAEVCN